MITKGPPMIDTIKLLIPPQNFQIINPCAFTPSTDLVYQNQAIKAVQNPTAKERKSGIYKPCLTLARRKDLQGVSQIMLTIEFCAPKLLFGENFTELQQKDLDAVVAKLQLVLHDMGVQISCNDIKNAAILTVHYAQNINHDDG